jgi:hypothetical protein
LKVLNAKIGNKYLVPSPTVTDPALAERRTTQPFQAWPRPSIRTANADVGGTLAQDRLSQYFISNPA